jgi:hypothetical protein
MLRFKFRFQKKKTKNLLDFYQEKKNRKEKKAKLFPHENEEGKKLWLYLFS